MRTRLSFCCAVLAFVGFMGVTSAQAQQDSLVVVCDHPCQAFSTDHIPVYARVNAHADTGLTGIGLMFGADPLGLHVSTIEWNGISMGLESTAINDYIGSPETWDVTPTQFPDSCFRGVFSFFSPSGISPSIPSGYQLLCWLVIETRDEGLYFL